MSTLSGEYKDEQNLDFSKLKPTNLRIINGIGPNIETMLHDHGIENWKLLSSKSKGELRELLVKQKDEMSKADAPTWSKQAFKAMNRDWDGLIAFQNSSFGDSKLLRVIHRVNKA